MPTPPPVPASQRYPVQLRDFLTYLNQPQDPSQVITTPDPNNPGNYIVTDRNLDAASVTRDLHTEIMSMESIIGVKPFTVPTQNTMGQSVVWLHNNKSPGHADPNYYNNVPPLPPPSHNHVHHDSGSNTADDHLQYVRADGSRGFSAPVTAPAATKTTQLITLNQARNAGLNGSQVEAIIQADLAATSDHPITGPHPGRYRMTGGVFYGPTDVYGNIWLPFGANFSHLVTFVFMKMPFPGGSMLGWYAFQYMEDQLIMLSLNPQGATIQFIEDIAVDRQALVSLCWMAVGY